MELMKNTCFYFVILVLFALQQEKSVLIFASIKYLTIYKIPSTSEAFSFVVKGLSQTSFLFIYMKWMKKRIKMRWDNSNSLLSFSLKNVGCVDVVSLVKCWCKYMKTEIRLNYLIGKQISYFTYLLSNNLVLWRSVSREKVLTDNKIEVLVLDDI